MLQYRKYNTHESRTNRCSDIHFFTVCVRAPGIGEVRVVVGLALYVLFVI